MPQKGSDMGYVLECSQVPWASQVGVECYKGIHAEGQYYVWEANSTVLLDPKI